MFQTLRLYGFLSLVAVSGWPGGATRAAAYEPLRCVPVAPLDEHDRDVGWRRTTAKLIPVVEFRLTGDSAGLAHRRESGATRQPILLDRQNSGRNSTRHWELMANWNPLRILGLLAEKPEQAPSSRVVCAAAESMTDRLVASGDTGRLDRGTLADAVRRAHRDALRDALEEE